MRLKFAHADDYGAAYWLPTGSTDGCWNVPPNCNVKGAGPTVPSGSCPDGMCTSLGFAMNESFLHSPRFAGFALSLYWPYQPDFSRRMFASTAANAKAIGLSGQNVVPTVSLGAAYIRNQSLWPNINGELW